MSMIFDSANSAIVEVEGSNRPTLRPFPPKVYAELLRVRQQLIDAGLVPDTALPPSENGKTDSHSSES